MPDNWFYYIVLVVLLVIMIVLGFFIGNHYQGDQEQLENELKESKDKVKSLEDKMKLDAASYEAMSKELEDIKNKFEDYIKILGPDASNVKNMENIKDIEVEKNKRKREIIQQLLKWFSEQSSLPSPKAEDLDLTEGGEAEYNEIINE